MINKISLIQKHTIKVKRYKSLCLLLIILVCAMLYFSVKTSKNANNLKLVFNHSHEEKILSKIVNPLLQGKGAQGLLYNISAKQAFQQDKESIYLIDLLAEIKSKNGKELQATANQAEMNSKIKKLFLKDNIHLTYLNYKADTQKLNIDFKQDLIHGQDRIDINGGNISIQANNFDYFYLNGKLNLKGNVKFSYNPEK